MAANTNIRLLILPAVALLFSSCSLLEDDGSAPPPVREKWRAAFDAGYKARRKKDWLAAQNQYVTALKVARQEHSDDKTIAEILTELGGVYAKQTEWLIADEKFAQAQAIYEKLWDPQRGGVNNRDFAIDLAKVLFSRATVLLNAGKNEDALKAVRKAHEIGDAAPAPDHIKGEIMMLEATILEREGRTEEAAELRKGATIFEATIDERAKLVKNGNWQDLLEEADKALGSLDYEYAEKAYNKALEQLEATRPDGIAKARALTGLATIYDTRKNYPRAEFFLSRAVNMLSKGVNNKNTKKIEIDTLYRLSRVQLHANKLTDSEGNVRRAIDLERQENVDGDGFKRKERHLIEGLVEVLEAEKKYGEAEKLLREKLDQERKLYGEKSLKLAQNYSKLAKLAALDGRAAEANSYYEKSINCFELQKSWNPKEKIDVLEEYVNHLQTSGSDKQRLAELTQKLEFEKTQIRKLFPDEM